MRKKSLQQSKNRSQQAIEASYQQKKQRLSKRSAYPGESSNRGLGMRSVAEKEAELQKLKDEAKADKDFEHNRATHIYTDPVTGKSEPVMEAGQDYDTDLYFDSEGGEVIGRPGEFEPIAGVVSTANKQAAESKAAEEADQKALEQTRKEEEARRDREAEELARLSAQEAAQEKADREKKQKEQEARDRQAEAREKKKQDEKAAEEKSKAEARKTRDQIKVRSRELQKQPHLTPRTEPLDWKTVRSKLAQRIGNALARSVPWAKQLEDAYRKLEGWNDQLIYADENVAIFKGTIRKQPVHYVVQQPNAAKMIAWAELSGKQEHSPAYWRFTPEQVIELLPGMNNSAEHDVLNTLMGESFYGHGDNYKYVKAGKELTGWKGGWRGAVTRPMAEIAKHKDVSTKPEKVDTSEKPVQKTEESIHETDAELLRQHQIELEKAYVNLLEEIEGLKEKGIHVDENSDLGIGLEELEGGYIDAISISIAVDELNKLRKENNIEPSRITVPPYPATSDIREGEYKDDLKKRIRSGMTQTAALESIRDNTQDSFYKILANRLLQVGLTGDIGYSEKLETDSVLGATYALGNYNKDTDNVTISKTGLDRRKIEHTILHELIHAATVNSLPYALFSLDEKSTEYKLNQLYDFLHDNHPDMSDHYGLKNHFELLAEGFTNPEFQSLLKKVPYQSDTAWSQFVDLVMELLGLSKDNRTALDEIMNLGEQVISEETGRRKSSGKGSTATVAVPGSDIELEVQYKVVENKDLVTSHNIKGDENPDYPSELQPRDRSRQGSEEQIIQLAGKFNPALATANPLSSDGAPIVNADNQVESGNGRTLALRNVYGSKPQLASEYKQYLIDHAAEFGLDPKVIEAMDQPQLVRERKTELTDKQLQEYLKQSNNPAIAESSATEQAVTDAKVIDEDLIQLFNPGADGSLNTAGNQRFLDQFYQKIKGSGNKLRTSNGKAYTKQFFERLQGAIFAKAYEDTALVSLALEENTEGVADILKALNVAAPEFARVKAKHGDLVDLNLVAPMVDGLRVYRDAKANNQAIDEYISQGDMLSGDSVPHLTGLFAQMIDANERRHKQMGVTFAELARDIDKELDRRAVGDSLFGPHQEQSLSDILNASNRLVREQNEQIKTAGGQSGFFSAGGKPTQTAESQESGRPAKTSSVENKQGQTEGTTAKTTPKGKLTKPILSKMAQYQENIQAMDDLSSGKAGKAYYDMGSEQVSGGLTEKGKQAWNKKYQASMKLFEQISQYAQKNFDEASWDAALANSGIDPDVWNWNDLVHPKAVPTKPLVPNPDNQYAVGDTVTITTGTHAGKTGKWLRCRSGSAIFTIWMCLVPKKHGSVRQNCRRSRQPARKNVSARWWR